jgi:glucose dehydrogenase
MMSGTALCLMVAVGTLLTGCATRTGPSPSGVGEWPAYAHDQGGMRHSPLTQITRENVNQLELAWTYRTGGLGTYG